MRKKKLLFLIPTISVLSVITLCSVQSGLNHSNNDFYSLNKENKIINRAYDNVVLETLNLAFLRPDNFSLDLIDSSEIQEKLKQDMQQRPKKYIGSIDDTVQGDITWFKNTRFSLDKNNEANIVVNTSFYNNGTYRNASFLIVGFNQNNTSLNLTDGNSIYVDGMNEFLVSDVTNDSVPLLKIKENIQDNLANYFINYPKSFLDVNKNIDLKILTDSANETEGWIEVSFDLKNCFNTNKYGTKNFKLKISGFKRVTSSSSTRTLSSSKFAEVAIKAGEQFFIFQDTPNYFSYDFVQLINNDYEFKNKFIELVKLKPETFFINYSPNSPLALIDQSDPKISFEVDGTSIKFNANFRKDELINDGTVRSRYVLQTITITDFNNSTTTVDDKKQNLSLTDIFIKPQISSQEAAQILKIADNKQKLLETIKNMNTQLIHNPTLFLFKNLSVDNLEIVSSPNSTVIVRIIKIKVAINGVVNDGHLELAITGFGDSRTTQIRTKTIKYDDEKFNKIFRNFSIFYIDWDKKKYSNYSDLNPEYVLKKFFNDNLKDEFINPININSLNKTTVSKVTIKKKEGSNNSLEAIIQFNGYDEITGNIIDDLEDKLEIILSPLPIIDGKDTTLENFSRDLSAYINNFKIDELSSDLITQRVTEFVNIKYKAGLQLPNVFYKSDEVNLNIIKNRIRFNKSRIEFNKNTINFISDYQDISNNEKITIDISSIFEKRNNALSSWQIVSIISGSIFLIILIATIIIIVLNKKPETYKSKEIDITKL